MRCSQVDLLGNSVTLYSGETKNDEGRMVALTEECRMLLTELRRGKNPKIFSSLTDDRGRRQGRNLGRNSHFIPTCTKRGQ